MPSSFNTFNDGDIIQADDVSEMHLPIQNLERGAAYYATIDELSSTSTAYVVTLDPVPDDPYPAGMIVTFKVPATNEAGSPEVTIDVNAVGPKPILKGSGESLAAGELQEGQIVILIYDDEGGGAFRLTASGGGAITWDDLPFDQPDNNTILGYTSLAVNTGSDNTAVGYCALLINTDGTGNAAVGARSLVYNSTGCSNSAVGCESLYFNITGSDNTAIGNLALHSNETGDRNVAAGSGALLGSNGNYNAAVGYLAGANLGSGNNNIVIGYELDVADPAGDDQINIGNAFLRSGDTKAVSVRGSAVAYSDSSDQALLDLSSRGGWVYLVDSLGGNCRAFVTASSVSIEASAVDWVSSSTPASGEVGLYVTGSALHLVLGSAAARSIGIFDQLIQF